MGPVIYIQVIVLRPCMGMVTGGKFCLFLGMVWEMDGRSCHRVMVVVFCMAAFVRACGGAVFLGRRCRRSFW